MVACNWVIVRSTVAESIHSKHNAGCHMNNVWPRRRAFTSLVAVGCVRRSEQYCQFTPGLHYDALASIASAVCRLKLVSPWQVGLIIFDIRSVIPYPLSVSTMLKLGGDSCLWLASTSKLSLQCMHEFTRSIFAKYSLFTSVYTSQWSYVIND
jgi:hypothetical protein